jgi:hypothetical protein
MPKKKSLNKYYIQYSWSTIYLTFQSLLVTGCTNKLNILTIVRSAHTVFMCFVFVWEQTATCTIYIKKIGFYNRDEKCLQRGTFWIFKWSSLRSVF